MTNLYSELFAALQRLLPHHALSRIGSLLAEARSPWLKKLLINLFIKTFDINLDEAASRSPKDYQNFNAFFTRALKKDARPIDSNDGVIVCPADGTVSQVGAIREGEIFPLHRYLAPTIKTASVSLTAILLRYTYHQKTIIEFICLLTES